MKVSTCINCGQYKYIEDKGHCRDCLKEEKINLGLSKNDEPIVLNDKQVFRNIGISGELSSGKTTLTNYISDQIMNDYNILYINFDNDVSSSEFNNSLKEIDFDKEFGFRLLDTVRDKTDKNYVPEVKSIANEISTVISKKSDGYISPKQMVILENVLQIIIDSNETDSFSDVKDCLTDNKKRTKIYNNSKTNLNLDSRILNEKINLGENIVSIVQKLSENLDDLISNYRKEIKVKDILHNNSNYIVNFSILNKYLTSTISTLFVKKIFTEIRMGMVKDYNLIFCLDRAGSYIDLSALASEYRHSRHFNIGFISNFESPVSISTDTLNNMGVFISFKQSESARINKTANLLNVNNDIISTLDKYNYIVSIRNNIIHPKKLDLDRL